MEFEYKLEKINWKQLRISGCVLYTKGVGHKQMTTLLWLDIACAQFPRL